MSARYTETLASLMSNEVTKIELEEALSTYPLYKGEKDYDLIPTREQLNTKLLNHYKYREIAFETVGRFLDELSITMNEIMPRYNELFKSIETMANIEDPFGNVDMLEEYSEERSDTTTSEGTTTNTQTTNETQSGTDTAESTATQKANGKSVDSDTPQDSLNISANDIDNLTYGSNASWNATEGTNSGESTNTHTSENNLTGSGSGSSQGSTESNTTVKHTFHRKGNQGVTTYAKDMIEFRTSIIDVVDQIINDVRIAELFMLVY